MLQSLSLYKLLGLRGKKGGAPIHSYHITTRLPNIH